jgi:glycosyltransferase involved in cell wall biosynthesis
LKVAFALEHYEPHVGGAEKLFSDLAAALVARGVEVRVVTSDSGGVSGTIMTDGVQVQYHPWRSLFGHPIAHGADLEPHVAWANVVLTSQYTAAPATAAVARRLDRPCVFIAYEFLGKRWRLVESPLRARAFAAFERWVFAKPYDQFIAISEATARDLIAGGRDPAKVVTIQPVFNDFADWRAIPNLGAGGHTFLYYGRPGRTKGVAVLLEAIARATPTLPPQWRFELILSDDPAREKRAAVQTVDRNGLEARVTIEDSMPLAALRERLSTAFCVIVPSLTEGFGFSAYQACCIGKNIISTDAGSLPEVVSGRSIVVPHGDAGALAAAIEAATRDEFDTRPDRVPRDGAERIIALCESLRR